MSHDSFDEMFEKVYRENYSFLVKYLGRIIYDYNLAEDLTHDLFLRLYKSKNSVITGGQLRNYLKRAAKNIAIDFFRKQAREEAKNKKLIPEIMEFDDTFYRNLENSIIEGEVVSTVQDVLENFSEKGRMIFISRVVENKSCNHVSKEQNLSSYHIKKIEHEILSCLRDRLKNYL